MSEVKPTDAVVARARRLRSIAREFWRHRLGVAALTFIVLLGIVAIFAGTLAPFDPRRQDYGLLNTGPSLHHWLGTDSLGRDMLSRLMYGARVSLLSSVGAIAVALAVAVPLAIWSGYAGGLVDIVLMRVTDALQVIPPLVLALAIVGLVICRILRVAQGSLDLECVHLDVRVFRAIFGGLGRGRRARSLAAFLVSPLAKGKDPRLDLHDRHVLVVLLDGRREPMAHRDLRGLADVRQEISCDRQLRNLFVM